MEPSRDTEALAALLTELCAFNSHTLNPAGVNRAGDIAARELTRLGARVERLPIERIAVEPLAEVLRTGETVLRPLGSAVRAVFNPTAPRRVLLCIHLDTVHTPDSPFATRREGDRLIGPGVVDAKGGVVVLLETVRRFLTNPTSDRLGLEVLLNPDEEIGSPGSVPLLRESAARCQAGLVFEPSHPDGSLVAARKGSGTFTFLVRGRSAHVGRDFNLGRNAITAAADLALRLEPLTTALPDTTVSPGTIEGGSSPNVVPEVAVLRVNVRVARPEAIAPLEAAVRASVAEVTRHRDGIAITVSGGLTSPPRPVDARNRPLYDLAQSLAREHLGRSLETRDTGGACDGNKLAAAGLPVLDSIGPTGGDLHSDREYVELPSLAERSTLATAMLLALAAGWAV